MKTLVVGLQDRVERAQTRIDPELEITYVELQPLETLAPHLADAEILLTTPQLRVDDALLDQAPRLRLVQVPSTGYDRIDVEATRRRGIPVSHSGGTNALSVAEHVFMVMMALHKRLIPNHLGISQGQWGPNKARLMDEGLQELYGKTLGIVGFGRIGRQVARRAIPFELHTIYYDIVRASPEEEREYQVTFVELPELLRRADILTVHVPLDASTYHLIGESELRQLRPSAIVINAARGPLIDPAPLAQMVGDGLLAGAAVDVFETEPAPDNDPLVRLAMAGCERVLLTPHTAGVTAESSVRGLHWALANVARFARGEPPLAVVNGVDVGAPATLAPQF
jgi:phosphoglycerate dehydrogenase-like enzyme